MGANQTKSSSNGNKVSDINDVKPPPIQFKHGVLLDGMRGSGKSTVARALQLPAHRMLEPDVRFLTTPRIYANRSRAHPNRPYAATADENVWRRGGRGSYLAVWNLMTHNTVATIFVVDSTDRLRISSSAHPPLPVEFVAGYDARSQLEKDEILATLEPRMSAKSRLHALLKETSDRYRPKPLLVLATKQDVPGAMNVEEICDALDLRSVVGLDWRIAGIDADPSCVELQEAIDWLNYVIASPTDLEKSNYLASEDKDAWQSFNDELAYIEREYRDERLDRGDVLMAPPLFRTDGTLFHASAEQKKLFIVSPLTAERPEDITAQYKKKQETVQNYHEADGSFKPEYANVLKQFKPDISLQVSPAPNANGVEAAVKPAPKTILLSAEHSDLILPLPDEGRENSLSSFSSSLSSASSSPRSYRGGISLRAQTESDSPEISQSSLPGMIDEGGAIASSPQVESAKKQAPLENNFEKVIKPTMRKLLSNNGKILYGAITLASTPLPSSMQIPLAPKEWRKKHWYSKAKEVEMAGYERRDVHRLFGRYAYTSKQWMAFARSEDEE